mmetsp:Transcript_26355/g.76061  ORF Transcript_26355/g.76061 Transcript_26355/m.76061 type:complete len:331 (-) Transcript_26355:1465-2457(-)
MGGDGGTVSTNRRYLRGAGSASHTADAKRSGGTTTDDERERLRQIMSTCTITGQTLDLTGTSGDIVACPYGRLYNREAAVHALLRRMESGAMASAGVKGPEPDIGYHVRGLKDLHPLRFQVIERDGNGSGSKYAAVCPLTGVELNGSSPAILIVKNKAPKKKKSKDEDKVGASAESDASPNVLSERAIREVGIDSLQEEYGPFDMANCIRLAPTIVGGVFDKVKTDLQTRRAEEKKSRKDNKKKKDKKRSEPISANGDSKPPAGASKKPRQDTTVNGNGAVGSNMSVAEAARANVGAAVASNPALSSLFSSGKSGLSEKERRDALFTTNT